MTPNIFTQAKNSLGDLNSNLEQIRALVASQEKEFLSLERLSDLTHFNTEAFSAFMKKPYILRPIRGDRHELIVPRFIDFQAGWPVRTEGEYVVYQVSRFIDLISPLPDWLRGELGYETPAFKAHIEGDWLVVEKGKADQVYDSLGRSKRFSQRDAGISIDVSRVIEVDWLGGRAEAGQRALRTQHAGQKGELHILMTRREYTENAKRLSALYALNFDVQVKG